GGKLIANPTIAQYAELELNVIMACSEDAIVMVEGEANEVSEDELLDALDFGFQAVQPLIRMQQELAEEVGKDKIEFVPHQINPALVQRLRELAHGRLSEALSLRVKQERYGTIDAIK